MGTLAHQTLILFGNPISCNKFIKLTLTTIKEV